MLRTGAQTEGRMNGQPSRRGHSGLVEAQKWTYENTHTTQLMA